MLDLIQQQYTLEQEATLAGLERTARNIGASFEHQRGADTRGGQQLTDKYLEAVRINLDTRLNVVKRGKVSKALFYLRLIPTDTTAFIAIKTVLNGLTSGLVFTSVARKLGRSMYVEYLSADIKEADKGRYKKLKAKIADLKAEGREYRSEGVIQWYAKEYLDNMEELSETDYVHIGTILIEAVVEATDLAVVDMVREKHTTKRIINPTQATVDFLKSSQYMQGLASPVYTPMVVPPKPWTNAFDGGYLTSNVAPLTLIKTDNRDILEEVDSKIDGMGEVLKAVNLASNTRWTIDPWMVNLIDEIHKKGLGDYSKIDMNDYSQMSMYYQLMNTAKRFVEFDTIYIPYQLDFRGRIYAVPVLNPQGADWVKGMFRFAVAKPINTIEEKHGLMMHVANLAGVDKVSFDERVKWTEDNISDLMDYVLDPIMNNGWLKADKPFQFLQACRDICGLWIEGYGYKSSVPVALDGSCSGIQHYGAMTRDTATCRQVNLMPNDRPDDIYTEVSTIINKMIAKDLGDALHLETREEVIQFYCDKNSYLKENLEDLLTDKAFRKDFYRFTEAWAWNKFGVVRNVCKRSVMTFAYGSGEFGYGEQLMQDFLLPLAKKEPEVLERLFHNDGFMASKVLAYYLRVSIEATVSKPVEAMKFLQQVARETAKTNVPVKWLTPLGFPIIQDTRKEETKVLETILFGKRSRINVKRNLRDIDGTKAVNGVAPNFIHGNDATHLMMTVIDLGAVGIVDTALVHDSFGVHASDLPELFEIVRDTMEYMYDTYDVFDLFTATNVVPEGIEKPTYGNYDLSVIPQCDFAFA